MTYRSMRWISEEAEVRYTKAIQFIRHYGNECTPIGNDERPFYIIENSPYILLNGCMFRTALTDGKIECLGRIEI